MTAPDRFTVGDLRRAIDGLPDDMPVSLEIAEPDEGTDLAQADLRAANIEARCDEVDRLYLWGSYVEEADHAAQRGESEGNRGQ